MFAPDGQVRRPDGHVQLLGGSSTRRVCSVSRNERLLQRWEPRAGRALHGRVCAAAAQRHASVVWNAGRALEHEVLCGTRIRVQICALRRFELALLLPITDAAAAKRRRPTVNERAECVRAVARRCLGPCPRRCLQTRSSRAWHRCAVSLRALPQTYSAADARGARRALPRATTSPSLMPQTRAVDTCPA
jgi:hypothetical protein